MKAKTKPLTALVLLAGMGLASTAEAALINRLGGLAVYDSDFNITWLADANYAGTYMTWIAANAWAASLNIDGFTGWRLPTTLQPDPTCGYQSGYSGGYNCTGSEMGHLFYTVLGGVAGQSILATHNSNFNLFANVQSDFYWSGNEYAPNPRYAWNLDTRNGIQGWGVAKNYLNPIWAVRSGDVAAVPEPGVMGLLGIGALAWAGTRHKRRG